MDLAFTTPLTFCPCPIHRSKDGARLFFIADVRSRATLCSIDAAAGANAGGVSILTDDGSYSLIGEHSDGRLLLSKQSFMAPPELVSCFASDGSDMKQLTHFNRERLANTGVHSCAHIIFC